VIIGHQIETFFLQAEQQQDKAQISLINYQRYQYSAIAKIKVVFSPHTSTPVYFDLKISHSPFDLLQTNWYEIDALVTYQTKQIATGEIRQQWLNEFVYHFQIAPNYFFQADHQVSWDESIIDITHNQYNDRIGGQLSIQNINVKSPDGKLSAKMRSTLNPELLGPVSLLNKSSLKSALLMALQTDLSLSLTPNFLNKTLQQYSQYFTDRPSELIKKLVDTSFLQEKNGQYSAKVTWHTGQLLINQKPLSLQQIQLFRSCCNFKI
jgi:hypothetical protein